MTEMALKISLKPQERIIIGEAVISNVGTGSDLVIENNVPILREKDIMTEADANTPCRKIYFAVQMMYIDGKNLVEHHNAYWKLVREVVDAAPSTLGLIEQVSSHILGQRYYQALKSARKLIEYEREVIKNVGDTV